MKPVIVQEKSETFRVSAEMAELHSLLQTGKFERQSLQVQPPPLPPSLPLHASPPFIS